MSDKFEFGVIVPATTSPGKEVWLNSYVKCPECGRRGKVKNCKRYVETESWEMPWIEYEICVCPKCGADMEE